MKEKDLQQQPYDSVREKMRQQPMTNNLQDRFRERVKAIIQKDIVGEVWYQDRVCDERLKRCLENTEKSFNCLFLSEVEQAKKDLITELLNEAPEDRGYELSEDERKLLLEIGISEMIPNHLLERNFGFNQSNNQWRTLLKSKLK